MLILLLGVSVSPVYADYLQGYITRIDREKGTVEIILCDVCTGGNNGSVDTEHQAEHDEDAPRVTVVASWFPRCFTEGMMIYARGSFLEDNTNVFDAVEVFPRKRLGREDKTGVRSRFRHQRGEGHNQGHHEHHGY